MSLSDGADEFDEAVLVGKVSVQVVMYLVGPIWPICCHGGFPQSQLGVSQAGAVTKVNNRRHTPFGVVFTCT